MENIIQQFFLLINLNLEYIALLPAIALLLVGIFVETHYVSKVSFFLNSVTLIAYFGLKNDLKIVTGLITLAFFIFTTWSFLAYITEKNIKLPPIRVYEGFMERHPQFRRFGGSVIIGLILLLNLKI